MVQRIKIKENSTMTVLGMEQQQQIFMEEYYIGSKYRTIAW